MDRPAGQDQGIAGGVDGCTPRPGGGASGLARYLRAVEAVVRGPKGVAVTVAVFLLAGAVGGRTGIAIAGTYLLFLGSYCVWSFAVCGRVMRRRRVCPGWTQ
jgi:hypothetical protein